MKCKPYSEITVEIRTQLKTVKITSNIFAVHSVIDCCTQSIGFGSILLKLGLMHVTRELPCPFQMVDN